MIADGLRGKVVWTEGPQMVLLGKLFLTKDYKCLKTFFVGRTSIFIIQYDKLSHEVITIFTVAIRQQTLHYVQTQEYR